MKRHVCLTKRSETYLAGALQPSSPGTRIKQCNKNHHSWSCPLQNRRSMRLDWHVTVCSQWVSADLLHDCPSPVYQAFVSADPFTVCCGAALPRSGYRILQPHSRLVSVVFGPVLPPPTYHLQRQQSAHQGSRFPQDHQVFRKEAVCPFPLLVGHL